MADIDILDVELHGRAGGALTRLGDDRIVFGFDPRYIDDPERATLSLSFRDPFGDLLTDIAPTRIRAHPFFSAVPVLDPRDPAEVFCGHGRRKTDDSGARGRRILDRQAAVLDLSGAARAGTRDDETGGSGRDRHAADSSGAVTEFVRRLVFCALIGSDAQLKNWSVIYPDRRNPQLAPAYDLVSTIAYFDDDRMALEWFGGARRFTDLSEDLLARLASGARLAQRPVVRAGRTAVERFLDVWAAAKGDLGVPGEVVARIDRNIRRVPLGVIDRSPSSYPG